MNLCLRKINRLADLRFRTDKPLEIEIISGVMEGGAVREGETSTGYCDSCKRETQWTLVQRVFHNFWKCLECGLERVASNR